MRSGEQRSVTPPHAALVARRVSGSPPGWTTGELRSLTPHRPANYNLRRQASFTGKWSPLVVLSSQVRQSA